MSVDIVRSQLKNLAAQIGQAGIHYLWPNDFEYYVLGLDLTDSEDRIIESLVFPVMPDNIVEPRPSISTVKKTASGVVSMYNTSFVPFDISVRGSFGRKIRLLSNNAFYSTKSGGIVQGDDYNPSTFNTNIKTGYGTTKLLERIKEKAYSVDQSGNPVRLYYYNLAFNSQYLVEIRNITFQQDMSNNMIWNYTMNLKAIAPAYLVRNNSSTSTIALLSSSVINSAAEGLSETYRNAYKIRRNKIKSTNT